MFDFGQRKLIFCLVETVCFCSQIFTVGVGNFRGNQFCKKNILLLEKTISLDILARRSTIFSSGNVFFNECFISGSGNGLSGQYKSFFAYFSETPASEFFSPVSWKRIFEQILHSSYCYWRRIFSLEETVQFI